jgi:hypothetical protein
VVAFRPADEGEIEFQTADGTSLRASDPIVKAAWGVIASRWPNSIAFEELVDASRALLGEDRPPRPEDREDVGAALLAALGAGLVELHLEPDAFALSPGERPDALPLARLQAEEDCVVTNGRHRSEILGPLDRRILPLLDGTRTAAEVARAVREGAEGDGAWPSEDDEQRMLGPEEDARVQERIEALGRRALLRG